MLQLLLTADFMHRQNIIHRDLKPENVLLNDKHTLQIQITDFGFACAADDLDNKKLKCGSPGYMAPEVLRGQPFDVRADIFSLGCIFYYLITKRNIFNAPTLKQMLLKNQYSYPFDIIERQNLEISGEAISVLKSMLERNLE